MISEHDIDYQATEVAIARQGNGVGLADSMQDLLNNLDATLTTLAYGEEPTRQQVTEFRRSGAQLVAVLRSLVPLEDKPERWLD